MAYRRLLLLLLGVISSHLPEVQARPIDFWCNYTAKIESFKELNMTSCVGSATLSSPVQLPYVGLNFREWKNKSLQQKRAEVVEALQMFRDAVQSVRSQTTLQCHFNILEHRISNYLAIVEELQIQSDTTTPSPSAVETYSSETSLTKVLEVFENLLSGKLRDLARHLKPRNCPKN